MSPCSLLVVGPKTLCDLAFPGYLPPLALVKLVCTLSRANCSQAFDLADVYQGVGKFPLCHSDLSGATSEMTP